MLVLKLQIICGALILQSIALGLDGGQRGLHDSSAPVVLCAQRRAVHSCTGDKQDLSLGTLQ